ncbi:hypothetical protein HanRHA438_Chr09g0410161 [Helianthus annuus]|nr:hypothetical protein HanRHA438_Chr09g0410161 [Helianthus annuus]
MFKCFSNWVYTLSFVVIPTGYLSVPELWLYSVIRCEYAGCLSIALCHSL